MSFSNLEKSLMKDISEYRKDIEIVESLNRLMKNKDFNLVISKGYLVDEALRLVKRKCSVSGEEEIKLIRFLDSISSLQNYFDVLRENAEIAKKSLNEAELTLEDISGELV